MDGIVLQPGMIQEGGDPSASYRAEVLADSPVSYWRLGESSGSTAFDESGSNDGSYINSPTLGVSGIFAGDAAVDLDGSTQQVEVPHSADLSDDLTSGFTVEAWVNPDTVSGGDTFSLTNPRVLFIKNNSANDANYWLRLLGGKISFGYRNQADTGYVEQRTNAEVVLANVWSHIVAVHDGSSIKLYMNGVEQASSLVNGPMSAAKTDTYPLYLAVQGTDNIRRFDGAIDEVAVYASALSHSRILAHYNAAGI